MTNATLLPFDTDSSGTGTLRWVGDALRWLDAFAASRPALRGPRSALRRDLLLPDPPAEHPEPAAPPALLSPGLALSSAEPLARALDGKVVLITGGSSGIGLETARRVASAGATTLICGRDPQKLLEAQHLLAGSGAVQATAVDLSNLEACDAFVRQVLAQHGHVDVLINNAGRSIRRSVQHSLDRFHDLERTMQINYFGALRVTLGLLPEMARRRAGHVINVSSASVPMGAARFSAYAASKAALDTWTRCAASEYADLGVEFTTIYMPLVRTPMIAPTQSYDRVPALSAEQAAELVVRAILERPARLTTPVAALGELVNAIAPRWMRDFGNHMFRSLP